ncbi:uncharacterized protein LOC119323342 [Triticum dicoccoides]|uniref:uncharacterized protein LOC119323342 n=1 Tax=Triticum dicoccoides TaxID=85692 RepID=UPI000E7A73C4|nr:uncharacterized protein LOC119323342 [Triticum dicoccoides]
MAKKEIHSERDRGFYKAYIQLTISTLGLESKVKLVYECHHLLESAVVLFMVAQSFRSLLNEQNTDLIIYKEDFSVLMVVVGLRLLLWYYLKRFGQTCYRAAAVVLLHYVLLLLINKRYTRIAIVPVIFFVFIGVLANEFKENPAKKFEENPSFQYDNIIAPPAEKRIGKEKTYDSGEEIVFGESSFGDHDSSEDVVFVHGPESSQGRMKMEVISCCLQLSFVICTQFSEQQGGTFVLSHFFLFINSSLGALAVMIAASPIGTSPGAVQVLLALHKFYLIMLPIATCTMAAEWLGSGAISLYMPEFIVLIVWFTNHFDHAGREGRINSATRGLVVVQLLLRNPLMVLAVPSAVYDPEMLVSWFRGSFRVSSSSSALSYLHVWMLHQWPGKTLNSTGPIKLLKFSAEFSFYMALLLAGPSAVLAIISGDQASRILILYTVRLPFCTGLYLYQGTDNIGLKNILWTMLISLVPRFRRNKVNSAPHSHPKAI